MIVAVDFDGTLCSNAFPDIGEPYWDIITALRALKENTDCTLILWTCRVGEALQAAVDWCIDIGLDFDEVNNNDRKNVEDFGTNPRKIFADVYIDDKSIGYSRTEAIEYIKSLIEEDEYE